MSNAKTQSSKYKEDSFRRFRIFEFGVLNLFRI